MSRKSKSGPGAGKLTTQQARTWEQICKLPRDNVNTKTAWFMVDAGVVYIHNQKSGEPSTEQITLSRATFERFVRWYLTGSVKKAV